MEGAWYRKGDMPPEEISGNKKNKKNQKKGEKEKSNAEKPLAL